ncbi:MAG: SDR family oxidoreductase [Spartobacteria bacterium]|nr:SDR family oxidoreductase [Spartobacteria bacterium]
MGNFKNKTAYVTGGAGGIGRVAALGLAREGADVAIVDINAAGARNVSEEIEKLGRRSMAIQCDVTSEESVQNMMDTIISEWGRIDIAFYNAGIADNTAAEDMEYAAWRRLMDINLNGIFLCCRAAGRQMIVQKSGVIINTASMSGSVVNVPQPQCSYNTSKAGVIMLTKSLAMEWAPHNVRVNCISPGYIGTEMTLAAPEEWKSVWTANTPQRRMGKPEELVSAILYLADDSSTYTTGLDLVVDGGYSCV